MNHDTLHIYTDGSSRGNPGPGGWGVVITADGRTTELGGHASHTTNNRMELTAAIEALSFLSQINGQRSLVFYSDSEYLVKGMTAWVRRWEQKGWKTAAKRAVENQDLWKELVTLTAGKNISWRHVAGHADNQGNIRADEIATAFADRIPLALRQEYGR